MKFGFILPNFGGDIPPRGVLEIAKICEAEGFDSVWASDHIVLPSERRETYAYELEPFITLSLIAASTDKLRLGTSVLVLPQRHPVLVAKQAATLDAYSGGRLTLGFGVGWIQKEFEYLGADFKNRGSVMEESIRLIRDLWTQDTINFEGEFFNLKNALFLPKPTQETIPIWIAGNGRRAVDRAIRLGEGWHPIDMKLDSFASATERIRGSGKRLTISIRMETDLKRARDDYVSNSGERRTVFSGGVSKIRKSLEEYHKAGLEYACISMLRPSLEEAIEDVRIFGHEIIHSYS